MLIFFQFDKICQSNSYVSKEEDVEDKTNGKNPSIIDALLKKKKKK